MFCFLSLWKSLCALKGERNLHATRHTQETCRFGLQSVSARVSKCCLGLLPAIPFFLAFLDIELDSLESNSHFSCLCVNPFCVCDMDKAECLGEYYNNKCMRALFLTSTVVSKFDMPLSFVTGASS